MAENIYLHGSEDVRAAGNRMVDAADEMKGAASAISFALDSHQRYLDGFLDRLTSILTEDRDARKAAAP